MNNTALQEWAARAAAIFEEMFDEAAEVGEAETEGGLTLQAILQDYADIQADRPTFRQQMIALSPADRVFSVGLTEADSTGS